MAEATKAVVFDVPHPDSTYEIGLELGGATASEEVPWVTLKTAAGFTINFSAPQTLDVCWTARRSVLN
ncbi:hypothetical protein [Candidatus Magnetobacterium casense]|uniref:Uncharacterized protein n=1 Tax=Candidatus Magnetobacterium casense TaxID=1455061 RepID=A0ABS6S4V5_9BACT|nr:hypothetical protein [Candidatus Magnetobacterium casensis]MBV6343732.1 hypothetical protein [Candidatus Magnetobacterium casensis]